MADLVRMFIVTTPSGVTAASPQHTKMQFAAANVSRIEVYIPPGNNGNLAFQVNNGGGSFVPANGEGFMFADDQRMVWDFSDAPNNGNWEAVTYNTGNFTHSIWVYFHLENLLVSGAAPSTSLIGL